MEVKSCCFRLKKKSLLLGKWEFNKAQRQQHRADFALVAAGPGCPCSWSDMGLAAQICCYSAATWWPLGCTEGVAAGTVKDGETPRARCQVLSSPRDWACRTFRSQSGYRVKCVSILGRGSEVSSSEQEEKEATRFSLTEP